MTAAGALPRRTVLVAGALGGAAVTAALAGCTSAGSVPVPQATTTSPDVARTGAAVDRARAAARALSAQAVALGRTQPRLAALLAAVEADHAEHLSALGAPSAPSAPSAAASAAASPIPSAAASPGSTTARPVTPVTPATAVAAELSAAQTALDDAQVAAGGLAVLLTRIAAARAVHADLLASQTGQRAPRSLVATAPPASATQGAPGSSPTPPTAPMPTPVAAGAMPEPARDALGALVAGEYAAVYAYGVVAARVAAADRSRARAAWAWHMRHRDELEERLQAAGVEPPAAAPAYDLGSRAQDAAGLATAVEDGLAALAARAVAATTDADRRDAAETLITAARAAAAWRGRPVALPG